MAILGIDLGGTSLKVGLFLEDGRMTHLESIPLSQRKGSEVGQLITDYIRSYFSNYHLKGIGVAIPGIYRPLTQTVWAPNIPEWEDYPLLEEIKACDTSTSEIPIFIESDRSCYILGEYWQGNAMGCKNAIYLSVGTGIGAGILANGTVLNGHSGIAGSVGWMALSLPYQKPYRKHGCFEYHGAGIGWAQKAKDIMEREGLPIPEQLNAKQIFSSYQNKEPWAQEIIEDAIRFWGMGCANLVSIFDPETIIFGGGLFGPAVQFLGDIRQEAIKWAQPISIQTTRFQSSKLGSEAGLTGAAFLILNHLRQTNAL